MESTAIRTLSEMKIEATARKEKIDWQIAKYRIIETKIEDLEWQIELEYRDQVEVHACGQASGEPDESRLLEAGKSLAKFAADVCAFHGDKYRAIVTVFARENWTMASVQSALDRVEKTEIEFADDVLLERERNAAEIPF